MAIKQRIEQDLKTALLAGDSDVVSVLRSLKSAVMYVEIAKGIKGSEDLSENETLAVLAKESKKRQESADLFAQAGQHERANRELHEKQIIDEYLPVPIGREDLLQLIDKTAAETGGLKPQNIGRIIAEVKQRVGVAADGSLIAQLVKERL